MELRDKQALAALAAAGHGLTKLKTLSDDALNKLALLGTGDTREIVERIIAAETVEAKPIIEPTVVVDDGV